MRSLYDGTRAGVCLFSKISETAWPIKANFYMKKEQEGNDQEMVQSERKSHSKHQGGKN